MIRYLYLSKVYKQPMGRMTRHIYNLLKVSGKDWFEINEKARAFADKHNLQLAGGSTYIKPKYDAFIIDIERVDWFERYSKQLSLLLSEAI